jgi:hypothetical protein
MCFFAFSTRREGRWSRTNHGPAGFDPKAFTGPFLTFWSFGNYLLPLAILVQTAVPPMKSWRSAA